ncbi:DUF2254 domain-containing protein [Sphingomonas sp. S-NIH.Pt15_0812]|uniref:DUF2254 domain-containing protein n=1 Tax=Sphingomonas sp. S-NIH.Pt15_0812 TaxID=1920129 RepID=UPI000F7D7D30|nr:DUF2254 domain-containing protein [Sphingomonas sp. S-NIH.Pt15_0812]RSU49600.1 DUF2254 domain-containing protein [Sphingomonas sp. S-NIH.Pt15_0812]
MPQWSWILRRIVRRIWFRAGLISLLSVMLAILAGAITPYLPYRFDAEIGQRSVGTILQIMASSMLAVTTFSLTAMVSAYSSATQLATPRATQLMISDPTSQNALSTFLGAFVFAMVGIVGLNTSAYGHDGRIILFAATVLIILLVVATLLRWIGHITAFGRMADVIDRVEDAATRAMRDHAARPHQGGRPAVPVPAHAVAVTGTRTGYVTHIDMAALGHLAERHGLTVHVVVLPGTMVHPARPLLRVEGMVDDQRAAALIATFSIERHRSFDQDPRLGLIALSEIASRALAPATNDPGTGIEVLNALLRVFLMLRPEAGGAHHDAEVGCAVHIGRPAMDDMLTDAFGPILREGGQEVEVAVRLTGTLAALHANLPGAQAAVTHWACRHAARVADTLTDPMDLATFRQAYARWWPA